MFTTIINTVNANISLLALFENEMTKDWLIDWCLTPTSAIFQLHVYCGVKWLKDKLWNTITTQTS